MSDQAPLIAAIEAGGTKFVCGVARDPFSFLEVTRIPTTTPAETLESVSRWLSNAKVTHGPIGAIGIGSFGPLDLDPRSEAHGFITTTPKPGWQHTDLKGFFRTRFRVPVGIDTDVNAAVLAEHFWGAGQGLDPLVYITVGTGVGGGVLIHRRLLHGIMHPEIGHLSVPPPVNSQAIHVQGVCPFHKHCVEGYVSGPALARRWGVKADALPHNHPAWEEMATTMAHALMNLTLTLCPRRIILGGGVMQQPHLIPLIQGRLKQLNNGYYHVPELGDGIEQFITASSLDGQSGILGSLALGRMALDEASKNQ